MPTLADAKLGGARLDEGFYCATYTALVTTSDVTLSHPDDFRPRLMAQQALSTPFGAPSPLWVDADIADKLETIHRDANFGAPSQCGFLKVKINDSQPNHLPHHSGIFCCGAHTAVRVTS